MELEREPLTSVLGGVLHICGQADAPLVATFRYLLDDPAAVSVDLESANQATWRFGRDLVREAFLNPDDEQGLGDVRALYLETHGVFRLSLTGVEGYHCFVYLEAESVADFIERAFELVPAGTDRVDVDAWLKELS